MGKLDGRVAIVTGGAQGIGLAVADKLAPGAPAPASGNLRTGTPTWRRSRGRGEELGGTRLTRSMSPIPRRSSASRA